MQGLPSSQSDLGQYDELHMEIAMILESETKKYAWDDGSNVELYTKAVQKARKE